MEPKIAYSKILSVNDSDVGYLDEDFLMSEKQQSQDDKKEIKLLSEEENSKV